MLTLKEFKDKLYTLDKSEIGCILGGAEVSAGGSFTVAAGTPHQTTIEYSSDTIDGDLTTYHQCENGNDHNCEVGYAMEP